MSEPSRVTAYIPVIVTILAHVMFIAFSWGVLKGEVDSFKNEVKSLNQAMSSIVIELKKTNESIYQLKENDIRLEYQLINDSKRLDRLETKHP
jgi:septal ring factor EnvC (AmiA/AmiB activator)